MIFFKVYLLYLYLGYFICIHICAPSVCHALRGQKEKVSGLLELEFHVTPCCGCWDLSPGPLDEQRMRLIAEPALRPSVFYFIACFGTFALMYVHHMCGVLLESQKRASGPLES